MMCVFCAIKAIAYSRGPQIESDHDVSTRFFVAIYYGIKQINHFYKF